MFKRRQTTAALHELQSHRFAMSETSCSQVMSRRNSTAIELERRRHRTTDFGTHILFVEVQKSLVNGAAPSADEQCHTLRFKS